jgi:GNAT superfamily N-acetyltransferase
MGIDADAAAAALAASWQRLAGTFPAGWAQRQGGAVAVVTGVQSSFLNGVWSERADPDPGIVAGLLDRVAATGLPHCLQLRPGGSPALSRLAVNLGMNRDEDDVPLMVLEDPARLGQHVDGLVIRQLHPEEAELHARVAAAGFEAPPELIRQLVTPDVLGLPEVRCYVGEADGRLVTTGIGVTLGACVGIFNVATPPAARRRGYGAAVTARAVADGLAAGATWSWLQSTPPGYPVYEQLGFRAVESWQAWVSAS